LRKGLPAGKTSVEVRFVTGVKVAVQTLIKGLVVGFSIAAPVGPIGVLCIRRTLASGRLMGIASGLGAASADMIYGMVTALGLIVVSDFIIGHEVWLKLFGGLFLAYLGLKTFVSKPAEQNTVTRDRGFLGAYISTFFLTLTNPATIFMFLSLFTATSEDIGKGDLMLVVGVFLGSASWWLLLSALVGSFRTRFTPRSLQWVNRLSGTIILIFGVSALVSLVMSIFA
jgi:threonine/homoserine/homoserine lactone efflux protein